MSKVKGLKGSTVAARQAIKVSPPDALEQQDSN